MAKKKDEPLVYNSFEELLEIIAEERRKSLKNRNQAKMVLVIFGCLMALAGLVSVVTHHHFPLNGFFGFTGIIAGMYAATQTQRKAVKELTHFDDVRMVPRLIEVLEYNDKELRFSASGLLYDLLPKLQASDAFLFTNEHHVILNRVLGGKLQLDKQYASTLMQAILKAMQQIGDESSLPIVHELAEGKGKAKRDPLLRQAATECLPFLRQRAEHQHQTETLLRAADGNITSSDILLRPAAASGVPAHTDELLRAAPAELSGYVPAVAIHTAPTVSIPEEQRLQTPG